MYIHLSGRRNLGQPTFLPKLPCWCANLRRAARALTQRYEKALEPTRLSATQLTILQVLARAGEVTQGQLGEMLAMDSSSLLRTLAVMVNRGGREVLAAEVGSRFALASLLRRESPWRGFSLMGRSALRPTWQPQGSFGFVGEG
jgi:hypothetical protein